jgi:thioredoxin 1
MSVTQVENLEQLSKLFNENEQIVIDFGASWCGPCKAIAPYFSDLSDKELYPKYKNVKFCKVDMSDPTDDVDELVANYEITSLPTFYFVKQGKVIKKMVGSTKDILVKNVDMLVEN